MSVATSILNGLAKQEDVEDTDLLVLADALEDMDADESAQSLREFARRASGFSVKVGFVWWVEPDSDEAEICEPSEMVEDEYGYPYNREEVRYGFFGNDVPPCAGEYLSCTDGVSGYRVLAESDEEADLDLAENWTATREFPRAGDWEHDGTYVYVVLGVLDNGAVVIAENC